MAVVFKTSMTKAELLEIAAENGVEADDSMTKAQIVAALEAYNDAEREAEAAALTADSAPTGTNDGTEGNNTTPAENAAESTTDGAEGNKHHACGERRRERHRRRRKRRRRSRGRQHHPRGERRRERAGRAAGVRPVRLCRAVPLPRTAERKRGIQRHARGRESLPCGRAGGIPANRQADCSGKQAGRFLR